MSDNTVPASNDAPAPLPQPAQTNETPAVRETLAEKLGTVPAPTNGAPGVAPSTPADPAGAKENSLVLQFVVFPLVIVFVAIAITGFFRWLAQDERTYDQYLAEISSGWKRKRPEAAYQLQFRLADKDDKIRQSADAAKTVAVFVAAKKDRDEDPAVRRYLAIVLGHLGDKQAVPALLEAASKDEPDRETRLNATWALGRCHDSRAVPALVGLLDEEFDGLRKTACYSLGELGDRSACDALAKSLQDATVDVRWNAALSLARLGDGRALPTLRAMLDRRLLDSISGPKDAEHLPMTDRQREDVMVNALRGILALKATSALDVVSAVADGDPRPLVRQAAMEVRDQLKALPVEPAATKQEPPR